MELEFARREHTEKHTGVERKRLPCYTGVKLYEKKVEHEGREVSVLVEKRKDGTERIRYSPDNFK